MEIKAKEIVVYADTLEENAEKHYGILFENNFILCFCCGSYIEPEDYIIIEHCGWNNIDQTLLKNYLYIRW